MYMPYKFKSMTSRKDTTLQTTERLLDIKKAVGIKAQRTLDCWTVKQVYILHKYRTHNIYQCQVLYATKKDSELT